MAARTKFWLDLVLLPAALITFTTGIVLLFAFHVRGGCHDVEALGVSRLYWQNVHRFGALLTLLLVLAHVSANARPWIARLRRIGERRGVSNDGREMVYYLASVVVCATGFVPWALMTGGTPVFGPTSVGPLPHARHQWIDVHLITGLFTLYLFARHLTFEWRAGCALCRRVFGVARVTVGAAQLARSSVPTNTTRSAPRIKFRFPFPRHNRTPYVDIQLSDCIACYGCVGVCQQGVLGKVAIGRHRHVHVDQPTRCTGCGRCVRSCSQRAIRWSCPTPA